MTYPDDQSPPTIAMIVGALVAILALSLVFGTAWQEPEAPEMDIVAVAAYTVPPCEIPPAFTYLGTYSGYTGPISPQGYTYPGSGLVRANLCSLGSLTITARGEPAGGEAPRLDVQLGSRVLFSKRIEGSTTFTVKVGPGLLALVYPNDFYDPQKGDRNLTLERVEFDPQ